MIGLENVISTAVMLTVLGFLVKRWMGSLEDSVKEIKDKYETKVSDTTCKERTASLVTIIQGMAKDIEENKDGLKEQVEINKECKHECNKFIFKHKHEGSGVIIP